jgi:chemosensory pili system protein ChpA (sensor histidine kinase/response regulator)
MLLNPPALGDNDAVMNDLGPLAWVLDELRKSLDGATKAMRRFVRDAELARGSELTDLDASHLRIARQQLHQAVGALEMVGMVAPAKILRAMESLAQKFVQRPELCSEEAAVRLERASFAVTEYLEGVLKGKQASPVALFPQYRGVMELASAERVHPADLSPLEWRWLPIEPRPGLTPLAYSPEVRSTLDRAVLKIVKTGDDSAAKRITDVCGRLALWQTENNVRSFWGIAAGFFEALGLRLLPDDVYVKRTASRILQQYASLAKGDVSVSDRLAEDLVFFCAQAVPPEDKAPSLRAVRSAYALDANRPVDYATEQFGRYDPAILVLARKRIAAAAETWSALAGGDTHRLKAVAEQFAVVSESMVKLHPESGVLASALTQAIDVTVRSGAAPLPSIAMEVATAVLYLEAAYEDLDPTDSHLAERSERLAQRLRQVSAGAEPEPMESWMEELYRRVSDRQTMGSVMDELRSTLVEVEAALDHFFRNPSDKSPLREVPSRLSQMRGVFSVLGLDQPALAALRMRASVEKFLVDDIDVDSARTGIFEKLGNSLGAMGFLIDMLSYQRALAKKLFVYDEALGEFKPLMGRERVVAPTQSASVDKGDAQAFVAQPVVSAIASSRVPLAAQSASIATTDEDDGELLDIFLEEAREVVQTGLTAIRALAANPGDLGEQTTLRRAFHTLKGSSRMVGLTEFGESAWAFEQLLNSWLAEQRPASDDLIEFSGVGMAAFGRWVSDIERGTAEQWSAADFRRAADSLRLDGQLIELRTPETAEPLPRSDQHVDFASTQMTDNFAAELPPVRPDFESTQTLSLNFPEQRSANADLDNSLGFDKLHDRPDFESTQLTDSRQDEPDVAQPDFQSTQTLDVPGLQTSQTHEDAQEVVTPDLLDSLDFGESRNYPDFAATQMFDEMESASKVEQLDFENTQQFDLASLDTLAPEPHPEEIDLGDLDFEQQVAEPDALSVSRADEIPELPIALDLSDAPDAVAAADAVSVHAEAVPTPELREESQEQLKVIGPLRLSIPLYNVYLNEADEWSRRLQTELSEWALEWHRPVPDSVVALAHSLGGSSATVGFTALSNIARSLEHALEHVQLHAGGAADIALVFSNAAEDIRRLLHQFAAGFLKDPDQSVLEALQAVTELEFEAPALEPLNLEATDTEEDFTKVDGSDTVMPQAEEEATPLVVYDEPAVMQFAAAPVSVAAISDDQIDAVDHFDEDLLPIFEEEASELLPALGTALRQWVARPDNLSARGEVLRVLHTLKGSARLAGAMRLGEMAHRMESSVLQLGSDNLQAVQLEPLLSMFDAIQGTFESLGKESPTDALVVPPAQLAATEVAPDATAKALAVNAAASLPATTRPSSNQSVRVRSQLLDRLVNQAGEVMISRSRMESRLGQLRTSLSELDGNLDRLRKQLRDVELQAESQMQSRLAQTKDADAGFDPLEFDRFTRVQELTRMMAESVNDVATVQRSLQRVVQGTEDDLIAQGRQARELQRDLLRTRMVEFDGISDRLYGVVRQAAKEAGKQVKLDIVGGSIEMDRGVLDRMTPAFEHMLRNAVGHGIESVDVRTSQGKPPAGTITIEVQQESNDVSVSFRDDGGGLHLDKIRAKAIDSGIIAPDQALSDADAANLLFMPGFSTAEQVTELSGRGIGMDVVRSEVNALGGRIETKTAQGEGSTFKLVLPLTTAVTQVVMLRMGEFTIGVPSNLMETVLRVTPAILEQSYANESFDVAGQAIPFYWSGALLQVSAQSNEPTGKSIHVAVFRSAGQRLALHVDEVLGNREVVVKNLGPQLARLPGLAGMSVLASGAVVLIYNPVALATVYGDHARQLYKSANASTIAMDGSLVPAVANEQIPLILVVDDSITVRRVTQRLLKREGYRVALANDGLHALEKLQEEKPTVVLSDIEMPRMDGFDLVRNIRADEKLRDLPIIMITSRIAEKHREHAKELGVDHYLGKPYSEEGLLELVRGYCAASAES